MDIIKKCYCGGKLREVEKLTEIGWEDRIEKSYLLQCEKCKDISIEKKQFLRV